MKPRKKPGGSCLIMLNGGVPRTDIARKAAGVCREIICADGAAALAQGLGLKPHFVIGDMDSLPRLGAHFSRTTFWCDFSDAKSDFQKCLDFARGRGFARVYIAGALGGRLDHSAVNLALAESAFPEFDVILIDRGAGRIFGPGRRRLAFHRGDVFSILPLPAAELSLSGCRYPLARAILGRSSRGLSNAALGDVSLTVHRGRLWVFSPDIL
ncbi:MAG: thiamine diphosphokinase [Elusimicrobiota bacterium]